MKLPKMRCDNCGKCCGPVTCTQDEYARIAAYAADAGIAAIPQGITCPYLGSSGCRVYTVRPFVCRLFGHVPSMQCANDHNVSISAGNARRLAEQFMPPQHAFRFLHEVCYSVDELKAMLTDHITTSTQE